MLARKLVLFCSCITSKTTGKIPSKLTQNTQNPNSSEDMSCTMQTARLLFLSPHKYYFSPNVISNLQLQNIIYTGICIKLNKPPARY